MKISTKIIIVVVLTASINIVPAFLRIHFTQTLQKHVNFVIENTLAEHQGISQLSFYLQRAKSNIREILLELNTGPRKSEIERAKGAVDRSISGLRENIIVLKRATLLGKKLGSYSEILESDSELLKTQDISFNIDEFIRNTDDVLAVIEKPEDIYFYSALFTNTLEPLSRRLQDQIEEFKREEFYEIRQELESISSQTEDMQKYVAYCSMISLITSIIIGLLLAKNIANSTKKGIV